MSIARFLILIAVGTHNTPGLGRVPFPPRPRSQPRLVMRVSEHEFLFDSLVEGFLCFFVAFFFTEPRKMEMAGYKPPKLRHAYTRPKFIILVPRYALTNKFVQLGNHAISDA